MLVERGPQFHAGGILPLPDDLAAGRLVEVLQPYNPGDRVEVHALYPADHGVAVAARVRVFIDFLTM